VGRDVDEPPRDLRRDVFEISFRKTFKNRDSGVFRAIPASRAPHPKSAINRENTGENDGGPNGILPADVFAETVPFAGVGLAA
jgi:hypothetical protein